MKYNTQWVMKYNTQG